MAHYRRRTLFKRASQLLGATSLSQIFLVSNFKMGPRQFVDSACRAWEVQGLVWVASIADDSNFAALEPLFLNEDAAMLVFRKQLAQRVLRAWIARRLSWAGVVACRTAHVLSEPSSSTYAESNPSTDVLDYVGVQMMRGRG